MIMTILCLDDNDNDDDSKEDVSVQIMMTFPVYMSMMTHFYSDDNDDNVEFFSQQRTHDNDLFIFR